MARTKKADYVSNRPKGTRTVTLELKELDWETLVDCLAARRIYFEHRRGESSKYSDEQSVDHYNVLIESLSETLANLYQQIDASYFANQIRYLREGG